MTKEEIITGMCYTWRHDYGLDKQPDATFMGLISSGTTKEERLDIYRSMAQLYEHHIQPIHKDLTDLQEGLSIVLPRSKEHAIDMIRVAQFYLDHNKD